MSKRNITTYLALIALTFLTLLTYYVISFLNVVPETVSFDSSRAYEDLNAMVGFGPRIPGTVGHDRTEAWIQTELQSAGWGVRIQKSDRMGHPIHNIIAQRNDKSPEIIIGAHYDSRMYADHDPDATKRNLPVPGANDGASGTVVLLELARTLPNDTLPVWLVFFDAEDNGQIAGWDWILGSRAFVEEVPMQPAAVVIIDMIGDANLQIYFEKNSDEKIRGEIWQIAAQLGYQGSFIPQEKFSMLDDHTPFLEAGIPAIDIIDFDYPGWHTTEDKPDKVSPGSLQAVGDTLQRWIMAQSK